HGWEVSETGFNGAVARTRRRRQSRLRAGARGHASMEPSRERDGDRAIAISSRAPRARLQWSRRANATETWRILPLRCVCRPRFNGAVARTRRRLVLGSFDIRKRRSFNGAVARTPRRLTGATKALRPWVSFNGAVARTR